MASSGKVILAAIAGLAVGVGVGMLIAPAKGSDTRKRIKGKVIDFSHDVGDSITEKLDDLKSLIVKKTPQPVEKPVK